MGEARRKHHIHSGILDPDRNRNGALLAFTVTNSSGGANARSGITGVNDSSNTVNLFAHGSGRTATRCGITLAKWMELSGTGSANGLLIGTGADNTPIVFGTNSTERGRWNGDGSFQYTGNNGSLWKFTQYTELLTLSTSGTTTDTTAFLLPSNALILAVQHRITTTISGGGVTTYKVGDSTVADRFQLADANLTAVNGAVGLQQWQGSVAADNKGPVQFGSAKVRITTDATPTQGAIRITVFAIEFTPPTS